MIGTGIIFFIIFALSILGLTISNFGIGMWLIAIPILQIILHFAWKYTFKRYFHRDLGVLLTLLGLFLYRMGSKTVRFFVKRSEKAELERALSYQPPMAEESIKLYKTHSKIMNSPLAVILGYYKKRPVVADLRKEHTLIAGSTQAGKTNLILSILIQLCSKPKSKRPHIYIIDLKADKDDGLGKFAMFGRYVSTLEDTLVLLRDLHTEMEKRFSGESKKEPAVVIIDEIHAITKGDFDSERTKQAEKFLSLLTAKAASSGISFIFSTQYPRYDVLPKTIVYNLLRKVCLPVDTRKQAEVIFGFRPDFALPEKPGEFLAKDSRKPKRGKVLLIHQSEIDRLILSETRRGVDDKRLKLWQCLCSNRKIGDSIPGMNKFHKENDEFKQTEVRDSYRHLAEVGVLTPPSKRGQPYKLAMEFVSGLGEIQVYIADGKWASTPKAFLENENV